MQGQRWGRLDALGCVALVVAFLASRALWLAAAPLSTQYWEEGQRLTTAAHLAAGAPLPLLEAQADHYQGGSLVVIGMTAALARLGLPAFPALKAVALGFSAATAVALFVIGRRFFGRDVAVLSSLIYLAGPPLVAFWGVVGMGFHAESVLLALLAIGWCLGLARDPGRGPGGFAVLGAIAGLAFWFTPTSAIALLACAGVWPLLARRPDAREALALAAGLGVGLAPWLLYNALHDGVGLRRLFEVFGLAASADPWRSQGVAARAVDLALRGPVEGLLDPAGVAPALPLLAIGVWLPGGLALLAALRRGLAALRAGAQAPFAERAELVFLAYGALFVAAYLASRFTISLDPSPIQYRLLVPPAVLVLPPIAISAARAMRRGGASARLAQAAFAVALVSLAVATLSFARGYRAPGAPIDPVRADVAWGHILARKHGVDAAQAFAALGWLPPEERERVLSGVGWALQDRFEQTGRRDEVSRVLERFEPAARAQITRGMRFWTAQRRAHLAPLAAVSGDPDLARSLAHLDQLDAWLVRPSVVVVTLDTTRVDHLGCYGYARNTTPNLDAFCERAVRFDRAWSTSSWTLPAHASLFTGSYPSRHGADYDARGDAVLGEVVGLPVARYVRAGKLPDEATTLAERLQGQGYRTGAFVAGPWLHRSFGLLQGFERKDDAVTGFGGRPAAEITRAALGWLEEIGSEAPYLLFVNYFDPHAPYEPVGRYPEFPRAHEPLEYDYEAIMRGQEALDDERAAVLRDRYDAEIRDMDRQLGRLLRAVLSRPGGERTLVIVTADHGEALGDEGRFGHGFWLSEELTRIPFLVRYPGDRDAGTQRDDPIQLVDVPGLVAEALGLPPPESADARAPGGRETAFLELRREPTTALRFGEQYDRDLEAVIRWPEKLVRSDDGSRTLTRLQEESLAEEGVAAAADAEALSALLDAHARGRREAPAIAPVADPETIEALRQLGYIE